MNVRRSSVLLACGLFGCLLSFLPGHGAGGLYYAMGSWVIAMALMGWNAGFLLSYGTTYVGLLGFYHLAFPLLALSGWQFADRSWSAGLESETSVYYSLRLVGIAINACVAGCGLAGIFRELSRKASPPSPPAPAPVVVGPPIYVFWAGVLMIAVFLTVNRLWGATYTEYWLTLRGMYSSASMRFMVTGGFVLLAAGFALLIPLLGQRGSLPSFVGVFLGCVPIVFYGFRGIVTIGLLIVMVRWTQFGSRLRTFGAIALLLILPACLALVAAYRGRFDIKADQTRLENPIVRFIGETRSTFGTLVYTGENIESRSEQLWLGRSYFASLQLVIPFFSRNELIGRNEEYQSPSTWALYGTNRWKFERGLGEGYSAIAEAVLNFGTAGVFVIFGLVGLAIGYASFPSTSARYSTLAALTMIWLVWWIRNDSDNLFRPIIWGAIITMLLQRRPRAVIPPGVP